VIFNAFLVPKKNKHASESFNTSKATKPTTTECCSFSEQALAQLTAPPQEASSVNAPELAQGNKRARV